MGEVFLADQLGPLGPVRPVALKRMLPGLAADPETARLFLEEMAIAAQLNHPHIATTYDFGEIDGDYFLAMEYVEGLSLNRIISSLGPLPPPAALEIARQIADALVHAHGKRSEGRAGVVHHDVSPHNVMISREGNVKLLDFGIARAEAAVHGERVRAKAAYAAPEQLLGAAPDRRFDLWSLGVVLYECLGGCRPFEGDLNAILRAAEARDYPRISSLRPEVEPFEDLITRALEPNPEKRWLSAEAFRSACARLGERFGMAKAPDLALLVERSGGSEVKDDIAEVSGTGVAALDADAMAALKSVEPPTQPTKPRARWPFALAAVFLIAIASVAALFQEPPEPVITEAPVIAAPPPPPPPPPVIEPPAPEPPPPPPIAAKKRTKRALPPRRSPPPPAVAEGFGKLSVRTDPTWARLSLDGQPIGRTILYGRPLDPGTHRLEMLPGDDGFAPLDTTVTIKPGVTTNVFANFRTGEIKVVER
jgi:serine/threonine-protein kinase